MLHPKFPPYGTSVKNLLDPERSVSHDLPPGFRRIRPGEILFAQKNSNASMQTIILSSEKEAVSYAEIPQALRGKNSSLRVSVSAA